MINTEEVIRLPWTHYAWIQKLFLAIIPCSFTVVHICMIIFFATKPLNWGYLTQVVDISRTTYLILTKIHENQFQNILVRIRLVALEIPSI